MWRGKHLLIGLISVVGLLTSPVERAEATWIFDKFKKDRFKKDKFKKGKCDVPPTWGGVIPGDRCFVPTFVDENGVVHAYIDCQTGLVWDAEPSSDTFVWGPEKNPAPMNKSGLFLSLNICQKLVSLG